ncbi:tyrosine--tRNA ligase [Alkaliphilus serpentinus]|uniref:Tyrosine--tRNA ligase n=1 Tax=Alkaliphilus serpentinus TaxID=1482731 RepID=A0A833HN49_9FIRM|nr:tyrosine--tRNA ligase [Alkaliphilus serpentinus]KAB3529164.1 tyrosine--tRNA ligase [Alkaliphilus serpentinus]
MNVFDILKERGFIQQATHEDEIRDLLAKEKVTFYIGFDPTADSLHVGHFLQVIAMAHLQRAGHKPIFLIGGGTAMVGDPTGKTDMRKMLTSDEIQHNGERFLHQTRRFLEFSDDKGIMENNAEWLLNLTYVPFLREIGRHFSVNRMLTAECFKSRMEKGLSFLEFNYMIMQAYDFLQLYRKHGCKLQLGGDDQWSNIIAGADLIRRVEGEAAYGMTFTLLTTSEGNKMGKTESGAIWLDPEKTSPFDFYQYWRNVDDRDVEKCLSLLTFLPMEEVTRLGALEGAEINRAKEVLAFEVTKLVHGEEEAQKADEAAKALFKTGGIAGSIPTTELSKGDVLGIDVLDLLMKTGLTPSRGEGRRLVQQGGVFINDEKVTDIALTISENHFIDGGLMIKKGKKTYHRVELL